MTMLSGCEDLARGRTVLQQAIQFARDHASSKSECAGAERQWMDEVCETTVCNILREQLDERTVQARLDLARGVNGI